MNVKLIIVKFSFDCLDNVTLMKCMTTRKRDKHKHEVTLEEIVIEGNTRKIVVVLKVVLLTSECQCDVVHSGDKICYLLSEVKTFSTYLLL